MRSINIPTNAMHNRNDELQINFVDSGGSVGKSEIETHAKLIVYALRNCISADVYDIVKKLLYDCDMHYDAGHNLRKEMEAYIKEHNASN